MSIISRQLDERSYPLRPFAPRGQTINTDVHGNATLVSYSYPADYGEKMDSAGCIGDRSMAGKRDVQYGTVLDRRTILYLLTDSDIQALLRWMPGGRSLPKLRGILLGEFHRTATELPALSWPDITALLNTRSPAPAAAATPGPVANDAPMVRPDPAGSRRGRMPKDESELKRTAMLALIREHPTLKDDPAQLAQQVGISESTARRWLADEHDKYRQSRAANSPDDEE